MKRFLRISVIWLCGLLYKDFKKFDYKAKALIIMTLMQKIIGKNRQVPWPVHQSTIIKDPKKLKSVNRPTGISPRMYIDARNGINIEENVYMGPGVYLISQNHDLNDYTQYTKAKPIIIRKNTWIGANAIILSEVELGEHTVVGAGSVVTKPFTAGNQLIAGNPARVVKRLNAYSGVTPKIYP